MNCSPFRTSHLGARAVGSPRPYAGEGPGVRAICFGFRASDFGFSIRGVSAFRISDFRFQISDSPRLPLIDKLSAVYDRSRISRQPMSSAGIARRQIPLGRLAAGNSIKMTKTFFTWALRKPRERSVRQNRATQSRAQHLVLRLVMDIQLIAALGLKACCRQINVLTIGATRRRSII